jgi:serine/threonine-protein kinase
MWFRRRRLLAGRYELLDELGSGGTGTVYKARDRRSKRIVAVKVLHPFLSRQRDYVERFRREAQVALTLDSRHIVQVLNYGHDDNTFFLVMEFIDGTDLDKLPKPLPVRDALRIATQVARALEEAHSKGIVHRDVKPQNIIVQPAGNVKVADLGIAREAGFGTRPMGSYHYTAPEAYRGEVDHRSDIYSLGVVLYELLTGRVPFPGDTPAEVMRQHLEEEPESIAKLLPDLDPEIAGLVERSLAKEREARPQSAAEVRQAIEAVVADVQQVEGLDLRATRPGGLRNAGLLGKNVYLLPQHVFRVSSAALAVTSALWQGLTGC